MKEENRARPAFTCALCLPVPALQRQAERACRCLLPGGRRQQGRKTAGESGRGLFSRARSACLCLPGHGRQGAPASACCLQQRQAHSAYLPPLTGKHPLTPLPHVRAMLTITVIRYRQHHISCELLAFLPCNAPMRSCKQDVCPHVVNLSPLGKPVEPVVNSYNKQWDEVPGPGFF